MGIRRFSHADQQNKGQTMQRKNINELQVHVPDLSDFINDMFFGTLNINPTSTSATHNKAYNLTGHGDRTVENSFDGSEYGQDLDKSSSSRKSVSGSTTEEWLTEARRLVASSPSRCQSPSRLGSPRFAASAQGSAVPASVLDRRDPLSRSARRHRAIESFTGEILTKSTKHSRNKSETFTDSPGSTPELSSTSALHGKFSDAIRPSNQALPPQPLSVSRRSRFQRTAEPSSPRPDVMILAPPSPNVSKDPLLLSPPKNLVESVHRRSISSSTCSSDKIVVTSKKPVSINGFTSPETELNAFLKWQRSRLEDGDAKYKIILSGPSNSTGSMAAAICYAWLLENRAKKERKKEEECVVLPVMNVKRATMWKLKEASSLFYHVSLDVTSLLFADEVDLEGLMMVGKLSMLVIGQDVLKTNGEVRSLCTVLTDNYCEEAYDLLQTPVLKKLLLAAILLDTQNLNLCSQMCMTRDAEAVQLLAVGSKPNYRNALYDQLIQDQRDDSFLEALRHSYGKPPIENRTVWERKPPSSADHEATLRNSDISKPNKANITKPIKVSPKSEKPSPALPQGPSAPPAAKVSPTPEAARGKNKFFLAKWFGFGSK